MKFYVGIHHPSKAWRMPAAFVSVNTLWNRKGDFRTPEGGWILDSGAFTEVSKHGRYERSCEEYARQIKRWMRCGNLEAAVSQDYMCEPWILETTGMGVFQHQRLTIARYDILASLVSEVHVMPVLQGYDPEEYVAHIRMYADRLTQGMWVGVGSVCKRNRNAGSIEDVLLAIKDERPDLQLHGFGLKKTALQSATVQDLLRSADSMAWSYAARIEGRDGNSWEEALCFAESIKRQPAQTSMFHTGGLRACG